MKRFLILLSSILLLGMLSLQFSYLNAQAPVVNSDQIDFRPNDPEAALEQLKNKIETITVEEIREQLDAAPGLELTPRAAQEAGSWQQFYRDRSFIQGSTDPIEKALFIDLNNDGLLDQVYSTAFWQVGINYQSSIPGQFLSGKTIGNSEDAWTIGDFNNDGFKDFIEQINDPVFVGFSVKLIDQTGELTVLDSSVITHSNEVFFNNIQQMDTVDLNGDGYDEIVHRMKDESIEIFLSDGLGGYSTEQAIGELRSKGAIQKVGWMITDLMNEDMPNIVYSWLSPGLINIGIDTLYTDTITATSTLIYPLNATYELVDEGEIQIADIDSNGESDVLFPFNQSETSSTPAKVIVWLQKEGVFGEPIEIPLENKGLIAIETGDVNDDGQVDLITTYESENENIHSEIILLTPNLDVLQSFELSFSTSSDFNHPSLFVVADFNQDSHPDILYGSTIYFHTGIVETTYIPAVYNLFYDYRSFTDDFSNPSSGWPIYNDSAIAYNYVNGEYSIQNKSEDLLGLAVINHKARNYRLDVQGRKASRNIEGGFGVVINAKDDLSYFEGFIVFTGYDVLWHIDVGPDGRLRVVESKSVSSLEPNGTYSIRVDRNYNSSNRVSLGGSSFSSFGTGLEDHRVGFITLPLANGYDARFDNFSLVPPEDE